MTARMWSVKIYLNEVGWDGEPSFAYFETEELAQKGADELGQLWLADVDIDRDIYALDLSVEEVPAPAFDLTAWAAETYKALFDEVGSFEGWHPVAT